MFKKLESLLSKRSIASVVKLVKLSEVEVQNEPILKYDEGSKERKELKIELDRMLCGPAEVPIYINGKEHKTDVVKKQVMPHNHSKVLANFYYADEKIINEAIKTAVEAQKTWDKTTFKDRVAIYEKAVDLMAGSYRQKLNASTMLGQSKTVIQAEIDAACELIDFFRMNIYFLEKLLKYKPISENAKIIKNSYRYRGIDGFIAAITPFNFTAIAGNLAYTPAFMGNAVLWKPSDSAVLSNSIIYKIFLEAGFPPNVVSFIPCDGPIFGNTITVSPDLAGITFTGSGATFKHLWKQIANNIDKYKNYPRVIGECSGKNFHFVHPSADIDTVVACTIRSAFEYSGQKCSACSRMFVPSCCWEEIKKGLIKKYKNLSIGDVCNFKVFTSAVINEQAYNRIVEYIEYTKKNEKLEIIAGGNYCNNMGYFIDPTIIVTKDPMDKLMIGEIFGPILTIYVYDEKDIKAAMKLVDTSTNFALTGSVFAQDQKFLEEALEEFKMAAGNFYINDKSTGSVVGQQPFGGGRLSGTNDKAGGPHYLLKYASPQTVKETFVPQTDVEYSYMCSE